MEMSEFANQSVQSHRDEKNKNTHKHTYTNTHVFHKAVRRAESVPVESGTPVDAIRRRASQRPSDLFCLIFLSAGSDLMKISGVTHLHGDLAAVIG